MWLRLLKMASYFRLFAYRKFVSLQYGNDFYNSEKKVYQALFGIFFCVCVQISRDTKPINKW